MNRLTPLTSVALLLASFAPCHAEEAAMRERTSFNADWRFHRRDPAEVKQGNPWISYFDKKDGEVDYNGDATDLTTFSNPERRAFDGLALAIVRSKAGEAGRIHLRAISKGLKPAECIIRTE